MQAREVGDSAVQGFRMNYQAAIWASKKLDWWDLVSSADGAPSR